MLRLNLVLNHGVSPVYRVGVYLYLYLYRRNQSRIYQVAQLRTDDVHCQEYGGTRPIPDSRQR